MKERVLKDTGIGWIGAVPDHWAVAPAYSRFSVELGKMLNPESSAGPSLAPYLGNADVRWRSVDVTELKEMSFSAAERLRFRLRGGDLLVCEGGDVGRTAIWKDELPECYYQKAIHRLRPRRGDVLPEYFYYVMVEAAYRGAFLAGGNKSTIAHLTAEKLKVHRFPFPPLHEQIAIAGYLDRRTARLDDLVASKERLLALLAEKRQASVGAAVTRGLDAEAEISDSGVDWLGELPKHWTVRKLSTLLRETPRNGISPPVTAEGNVSTFSIAALRAGKVRLGANLKVVELDPNVARLYRVSRGDIFVMRGSGSLNLAGSAGILVEDPPENCIYPDILIRLRPGPLLRARYMVELLNSKPIRAQIETSMRTAAGIWKVSGDRLGAVQIPLPPLKEQEAIESRIVSLASDVDQAIDVNVRSVEKLAEYRQALISAAVTGKIDVTSMEAA